MYEIYMLMRIIVGASIYIYEFVNISLCKAIFSYNTHSMYTTCFMTYESLS